MLKTEKNLHVLTIQTGVLIVTHPFTSLQDAIIVVIEEITRKSNSFIFGFIPEQSYRLL